MHIGNIVTVGINNQPFIKKLGSNGYTTIPVDDLPQVSVLIERLRNEVPFGSVSQFFSDSVRIVRRTDNEYVSPDERILVVLEETQEIL